MWMSAKEALIIHEVGDGIKHSCEMDHRNMEDLLVLRDSEPKWALKF